MRKRTKFGGIVIAILLACASLCLFIGCGNAAGTTPSLEPEVESVTLDEGAYVLTVGEHFTLTATVMPETATNKKVKWSVTAGDAVTVDNGKVTAVKAGEAVVTATAEDGGANASCAVTVKDKITDISFDKTTYAMNVGDEFTLTATVTPSALSNEIIWSTDPTGILKVVGGTVTALAQGTAKVVATDRTGTVKAECAVVVEVPATLELDVSEKTVNIDEQFTLSAQITPSNLSDKVIWSAEPAGIVSVEDGKVTGLREGTATVTASIRDGKVKATCTVTVELDMTIALDVTSKSMHIGDEFTLTPVVTPASQASLIVWSASPADVVSVANGKITALKAGTATVTASAKDGKFRAECEVTVLPDYYIELDKTSHTMYIGDKLTLDVTELTPSDVTVVWSAEPDDIVSVDNGEVTATAAGTATVTATIDGTDMTASCVITVKDPSVIENVEFAQNAYTIRLSDTLDVPVVFTPASSEAGKTVTYTSGNSDIVTVDANGKLSAVGYGRTEITATVGGFTVKCDVTVNLLANNTKTEIDYNDSTGIPIVRTTDSGIGVNAIDTGKDSGEYMYYAEATLNTRQITSAGWGIGIGLIHTGSRTNDTTQADFMYDKLHVYVFGQKDDGTFNTGYWHRQGKNFMTADDQLTLNLYNDKMGNCYNDAVKLFNQNTALRFGIARDYDFVYTIINGIIIERMPIIDTLKNIPTFPGLYYEAGNSSDNYMTAFRYVYGDEAKAVIESANVAFRYSRTTNNYKSAEIGENGLTARFNNFTDSYWNSSVSASVSFDGNTTMEFDLAVNSGANGHIFFNISSTPITMDYNTNIGDGGNTLVAGGIWVSDNKMNGNDLYQDTATGTGNSKVYAGINGTPGSVHVKIALKMSETGEIISTIIMTNGETVVYNKEQTSTKTHIGKDFRIHFLSENKIDYTVSNFKVAATNASATPAE